MTAPSFPGFVPAHQSLQCPAGCRLTLLLACCLLTCFNAVAQVSLVPQLQELDLNRGGKSRFSLRVANRGTEPQTFTMNARAMDISPNGVPSPLPKADERSCAEWIAMDPGVFTLYEDEVQIVECIIEGPVDAVGSYSAFITADYRLEAQVASFEKRKGETTMELGMAVSSVLLTTVRSRENRFELRPDSLVVLSGQQGSNEQDRRPFSKSSSGVWNITVPVNNTGNIHAVVQGKVSLWTEDMRLLEESRLSAGRGYILPGKVRLFHAEGLQELPDGIYLIKVNLQTRSGRMVQGMFPYSVFKGRANPGAASEAIRDLLKSFTPQFSLSTNSLDYEVSPGARRTQGVRIESHSEDSLQIHARLTDWSLSDSGRVVLDPLMVDHERSCVPWLEVTPNPLTILPGRAATAKIKLVAPEELVGEYYAAVVFETNDVAANLPAAEQLHRSVMVTSSAPSTAVNGIEINSIGVSPMGPLNRVFMINIENVGNVHCFCMGRVTVFDKSWKVVLEPVNFGSEKDFILPGKVRGFAVTCPGALENGEYKAVVEVKYHEDHPQLAEEYFFIDSLD